MDYTEFKDKCFTAAVRHGFDSWELYYAKSSKFSVRVKNGEIAEYKNAGKFGLSFRGIYKKKMGYVFTERMDASIIDMLMEKAVENAMIINTDDTELLFRMKAVYPEALSYNPAINGLSAGEKIQMALDMEKTALATDSRVTAVDYCTVLNGEGEVCISNSYGLDLSHRSNVFCACLQPKAEEKGIVKTWYDFWQGRDLTDFSPEKLARSTVYTCLTYLTAKTIPSGKMAVLFSPIAAIELFSAFAGIFFAERAQKGFSMLGNKVGESIASPVVTIHDDGICKNSIGSVPFDSEGVPCGNKIVIDKGILLTLLYNLKSAEKGRTTSTGNGFKPNFRAPVETACTNFYVEPSDISLEQMISGLSYGINITELKGLHSGANSITGDFSLSASGLLIEHGQITRPVEQIVVSGNFYDLLHNITLVGNDLRFGMPESLGTIGMPSILVCNLAIAGK